MEKTFAALADSRSGVKAKSKIREYIKTILWAAVIALIIRHCVIMPFTIPSGSMENTLLVGDYLFVNRFIYGIKVPFTDMRLPGVRSPERGDVIVFRYPVDRSKDFIKRVIGVPGDVVEIRNKQVFINGTIYRNTHEIHKDARILPRTAISRDNFGPVRVPANACFVMGDNRDNSYDSRFWGFVDDADIVGRAMIKYWSWDTNTRNVRWGRIARLID